MSFASPSLLAFLAVVPLCVWAYLWWERRREARAAVWASPALLPNMTSDPGPRRLVATVLYLVSVSLFLVAFARPQLHVTDVKPGATLVVAVDDSGSMAATDVAPNRLRAGEEAIIHLIAQLPSTVRVALVTFSTDYELKVPPTYDHSDVTEALPTHTLEQGTALGEAVVGAVEAALGAVGPVKAGSARSPAAVLVVSDGGQDSGQVTPAQAASAARKDGVPVSTLVVGTAAGTVTQRFKVAGSKSTYTETFQVPADPTDLQQVANGSGGRFYDLAEADQLAAISHQLASHLVRQRVLREVTAEVAAVAAVVALAAAALSMAWFRRVV